MTDNFKEQLQQAHAQGDYAALLELIPYAKLIGVECSRLGDELLFRLPANKDNIGNPLLPAIHGGVIAGFMELAAALHLLVFTGSAVRDGGWRTLRSPRGRALRPNQLPRRARISRLKNPMSRPRP